MPDLAESEFGDLFSLEETRAFVSRVYKNSYKGGNLDKKRVNGYAKTLSKAIVQGYGPKAKKALFDFDSPDTKMISALMDNVFHFSAAKNRAEIMALSAALRDPSGKLRSFSAFTQAAQQITGDFQGRYMKAEYDLAVNASTMAARWAEYEAEPETVLIYRTVGDSRVRPEHAALEGITKPITDPFWATYYPPNGWHCRCTVEPSVNNAITPDNQIPAESVDGVPPLFRSNFAREGLVFPKDHPYFISDAGQPLNTVQRKALRFNHTGYRNGIVSISDNVSPSDGDYKDKIAFARSWADKSPGRVTLLPTLNQDDVLREWLLPGYHRATKNPDFYISGSFADLKSLTKPSTYTLLRSKIKDGLKQADTVVLKLMDTPDDELLRAVATTKLNGEPRLKQVIFYKSDGSIKVYNQIKRT